MITLLRSLNIILLAGILTALILIWNRMPPSLGEYQRSKGTERTALRSRFPIIQASLSETLQVEVTNTPLSVEIE